MPNTQPKKETKEHTQEDDMEKIIFMEFINMISNIKRPTKLPLRQRLSK